MTLPRRSLIAAILALGLAARPRRALAAYSVAAPLKVPKTATVYQNAVAITPTDNTQIGPFACLYVGGTGNVALVPADSTTAVVFYGVPAGTFIPVAFQGINATNTTATDLVGLG